MRLIEYYVEPPCFDPTCNCCNAWRSLDDQRIEHIELLQQEVDLLKAKVDFLRKTMDYKPLPPPRQEYPSND